MMFTGGPTTVGPGLVVNRARNEDMRSHVDMQKNKAPHVKEASKFYQTLAEVRAPRHPEHPLRFERVTRAVLFSQRACANSHTIDVFACSLDQARRRAAPAREDASSRVMCVCVCGCVCVCAGLDFRRAHLSQRLRVGARPA